MQAFFLNSILQIPIVALFLPVLEPRIRLFGMAEKFHLHLLELARTEGEVSRVNFIPESLSDLRDAERYLHARRADDIIEVRENSLARFRTKIGRGGTVLHRADIRLEHQIEMTDLGELILRAASRALVIHDMIGSKTAAALGAIDHRIGKRLQVAGRFPNSGIHQDGTIHPDDVRAGHHRIAPPQVFDVSLQLDAERAVIPTAVESAVYFARLEDKRATPTEGNHGIHLLFRRAF